MSIFSISAKPFIFDGKEPRDFLLCFCCIYSSENDIYGSCYPEPISTCLTKVGIETFRSDQVQQKIVRCSWVLKTRCNNVVEMVLFLVVNNIERYC